VRLISGAYAGARHELKLGVHWLHANSPAEVSALLTRKDVATLLREGEGIEIRDSSLLHLYGMDYPR
jgi:hypothetical protein